MEEMDIKAMRVSEDRAYKERVDLLIKELRDQVLKLAQELKEHKDSELLHGYHGDAW